jgi:hypothetical protein
VLAQDRAATLLSPRFDAPPWRSRDAVGTTPRKLPPRARRGAACSIGSGRRRPRSIFFWYGSRGSASILAQAK